MGILTVEGMQMKFRYFDAAGRQITPEQLRSMRVMAPAMDHIFATVLERLGKNKKCEAPIENAPLK